MLLAVSADGIVLLGLGVLLVAAVIRQALRTDRTLQARRPRRNSPEPDVADLTPEDPCPVSFGYKTSWLAIKGVDSASVLEKLSIRDALRSGWGPGTAWAYRQVSDWELPWAFVTPPLGDWVLVMCASLPIGHGGARGQVDQFTPLVAAVSRVLDTEVQGFWTHRVVETHMWCKAVSGEVRRAYGYVGDQGEVIAVVGHPTTEELKLGLDGCIGNAGATDIDDDTQFPNESDVIRVAGAWSIDPTTLDTPSVSPPGSGWLGRIDLGALRSEFA